MSTTLAVGTEHRLLGVERARAMLAEATRTDEVKKIRDVAVAMKAYARTQKAGKEIAIDAGEIITRSDVRMGQLRAAMPEGKAGRPPKNGPEHRPISRKAIDRETGTAHGTASDQQRAAKLPSKDLDAYVAAERRANRAPTTSGAVALSRLPETTRRKAIAKLGDKPDVKAAIRAVVRDEAIANIGSTPALAGKFRVFYADPPWKYGDAGYGNGPAEFHYPTMSIEDLCALPIRDMAIDDSVLFLWVTSPLLEDAFKVINAWGFRYKASFVWHKLKHNVGHYNSVRHEFLLIATRGSCTPDDRRLVDSVQSIERTEHSEKPSRFREIIEQLYPNGPRIELFARQKAKGWEQWGNQI